MYKRILLIMAVLLYGGTAFAQGGVRSGASIATPFNLQVTTDVGNTTDNDIVLAAGKCIVLDGTTNAARWCYDATSGAVASGLFPTYGGVLVAALASYGDIWAHSTGGVDGNVYASGTVYAVDAIISDDLTVTDLIVANNMTLTGGAGMATATISDNVDLNGYLDILYNGTTVPPLYITNQNASNIYGSVVISNKSAYPAIYVEQDGNGIGVYLQTNGTGDSIKVDHYGGPSKDMLLLRSGTTEKFAIDGNGDIDIAAGFTAATGTFTTSITSASYITGATSGATFCYDAFNSGEKINFVNGLATITGAGNCP